MFDTGVNIDEAVTIDHEETLKSMAQRTTLPNEYSTLNLYRNTPKISRNGIRAPVLQIEHASGQQLNAEAKRVPFTHTTAPSPLESFRKQLLRSLGCVNRGKQ
jgi:hypothetical protein